MNVELLERVADHIVKHPQQFDMLAFNYVGSCGTTHCIGGWICALAGSKPYGTLSAAKAAGLDYHVARDLFFPEEFNDFGGWEATAEQAAARIRHFIATGETS